MSNMSTCHCRGKLTQFGSAWYHPPPPLHQAALGSPCEEAILWKSLLLLDCVSIPCFNPFSASGLGHLWAYSTCISHQQAYSFYHDNSSLWQRQLCHCCLTKWPIPHFFCISFKFKMVNCCEICSHLIPVTRCLHSPSWKSVAGWNLKLRPHDSSLLKALLSWWYLPFWTLCL